MRKLPPIKASSPKAPRLPSRSVEASHADHRRTLCQEALRVDKRAVADPGGVAGVSVLSELRPADDAERWRVLLAAGQLHVDHDHGLAELARPTRPGEVVLRVASYQVHGAVRHGVTPPTG